MSSLDTRLLQTFQDAAAITTNDTVDIARPAAALYIGTAGNIVLKTMNNTTITFLAVPVGILDISIRRVLSTNTTASGLIALYTTAPDQTKG